MQRTWRCLYACLFYALIGSETRDFDIADVCNMQADKLISDIRMSMVM